MSDKRGELEPRWQVGEELEEVALGPLTRLDLIKYAGASGDYNPIHTVDEAAHEAGLPGVIAHGMLTAATLGRLFSPHLERGYVKDLAARFTGMVRVGDTLRVGGVVTRIEEAPRASGGTLYGFEVYARTDAGTVVTGTAVFLAYEDREDQRAR